MSLYGFLSSLTEQRYKTGGLTVIYVPIETNNLTVTEACSNKELMDRLEKLIFLWTKQIRLALSESESQIINARFTCIIDEHKFWTTRCQYCSCVLCIFIKYLMFNITLEIQFYTFVLLAFNCGIKVDQTQRYRGYRGLEKLSRRCRV